MKHKTTAGVRRHMVTILGAMLSFSFMGCHPCEPGYGTLEITLSPADAYTASVDVKLDGELNLGVFVPISEEDGCEFLLNTGTVISSEQTGVTLSERYTVPVGWVCAYVSGGVSAGQTDPSGGPDQIFCTGAINPTWVDECDRGEVEVEVACEYELWAARATPPTEESGMGGRSPTIEPTDAQEGLP